MSDNFTDTSNYASKLSTANTDNMKDPSSKSTSNSTPTPQHGSSSTFQLPLASTVHSLNNVQPQQHTPRPIAIAQKSASTAVPMASNGSGSGPVAVLPAPSKKRGKSSDSANTLKPAKKKQTKPKSETSIANIPPSTTQAPQQNNELAHDEDDSKNFQQAGHRPVTSCTHCRQHKIKCNAQERFPAACQRCEKMNLNCEIDPQFRPRKGSQIQSLRNDVDELKLKIEYLQRHESLISQAMAQKRQQQQQQQQQQSTGSPLATQSQVSNQKGRSPLATAKSVTASRLDAIDENSSSNHHQPHTGTTILQREPQLLSDRRTASLSPRLLNDSVPANSDGSDLPPVLELSVRSASVSSFDTNANDNTVSVSSNTTNHNSNNNNSSINSNGDIHGGAPNKGSNVTATTNVTSGPSLTAQSVPNTIYEEFVLGEVHISLDKANALHSVFMNQYNTYFPILSSSSASELYTQSQLLFWTVCLTACLSDPEPTLYNSLASLIKQLAIETCWIRTPRSTHISQALLILCIWPLPNQKVLDDCSYRFVGLAKSLGFQLGLHRGKFMTEFSRTQVALPDAEKWRTRTWLGIFFAEQFWASQLGLPPSSGTDYLVENARIDKNLPKNFRSLISLSIFQSKLVNVMGSSVVSPDGLMEARNRAGSLAILERELERLIFKLEIGDDIAIEIYYLYVKLTICCFAFLPETPTEDQTKYVTIAYLTATKVVTLVSKLIETKNLIELPIYIRQSVTYAAFILFKLHLTPLLLQKYADSARQSIVTVHRMFRNQLSAWKNVQNDISRTAQVLEKLNYVLFTHPELYTKNEGIITRMRSHLTGSLFYDLVWCVHEARRRTLEEQKSGKPKPRDAAQAKDRPIPLPFYNQINKDDFQTITTTTPGGTTITTLAPTENAMNVATQNATANGLAKPTEIKGIPVSMLESTGSVPHLQYPSAVNSNNTGGNDMSQALTSATAMMNSTSVNSADQFGGSMTPPGMAASLFSSRHSVQGRSTIDSIMPTLQQQSEAASLRRSMASGANGSNTNLANMIPTPTASKYNYQGPQTPQQQIQQHQMHQQQLQQQQQQQQLQQQQLYQQQQRSPFDYQQSPQLGSASFDVSRSLKLKQQQQQQQQQQATSGTNTPTSYNGTGAGGEPENDDFNQFFQQQQMQWHGLNGDDQDNLNGNDDDFLGWFDMNMAPEF